MYFVRGLRTIAPEILFYVFKQVFVYRSGRRISQFRVCKIEVTAGGAPKEASAGWHSKGVSFLPNAQAVE